MKPRLVLAGGSGFIGQELAAAAKDRYDVIVLSRRSGPGMVAWDGKTVGEWAKQLEGAAAVVNFAGESVTLPWTDENKKKIVDSRVESARAIGNAILGCETPPRVWINASAVGFYGDTGESEAIETSPAGSDFLGETCVQWEGAATAFALPATRLAMVRIGFVLGKTGGAYPLLSKLTSAFIGGAVGSGKQWVPWIHVADLASMILWAIEGDIAGPFNGVAPHPVRNADLMATLRAEKHRPWVPPAPAFALGLLSKFGGPEAAPALVSSRVLPAVASEKGFKWKFPDLRSAIHDLG